MHITLVPAEGRTYANRDEVVASLRAEDKFLLIQDDEAAGLCRPIVEFAGYNYRVFYGEEPGCVTMVEYAEALPCEVCRLQLKISELCEGQKTQVVLQALDQQIVDVIFAAMGCDLTKVSAEVFDSVTSKIEEACDQIREAIQVSRR